MSMSNTEKAVKDIRRNTRRKYSTEEKIRIVLDGLRGESSIAEICRREGINSNLSPLEQGLSGGWQETTVGGHCPRGQHR